MGGDGVRALHCFQEIICAGGDPLGHRLAGRQGEADLGGEAVRETAQRRGDVGVVAADTRVDLRLLVRGEPLVAGAAKEVLGFAHRSHATRGIGIDTEQKFRNRLVREVETECGDFGAEGSLGLRRSSRQGAQEPDAVEGHELARTHAGKKGDLRVEVHNLIARLGDQFENSLAGLGGGLLHGLGGHAQVDGGAAQARRLAQGADLGQKRDGRMQTACHEIGVDALVIEAGAGLDKGALDVEGGYLAGGVELEGPEDGGAGCIGKQAGGVLRQGCGMQACGLIRQVDGLAALEALDFQRRARRDERHNISDGVVDGVAGGGGLDVDGLVQVHGAGRVDGHQRDVARVATDIGEAVARVAGFLLDSGREGTLDAEFLGDGVEIKRGGIQLHSEPA